MCDGINTTRADALLDAALGLLAARQGRMLTIEEWAALARAVAGCQGRKAAEYMTEDDLADIADGRIDGDEGLDGRLATRRYSVFLASSSGVIHPLLAVEVPRLSRRTCSVSFCYAGRPVCRDGGLPQEDGNVATLRSH